jgi:hypothetical protein
MLFKEIISVYSLLFTKPINTFRWHNQELLTVKADGTCSYTYLGLKGLNYVTIT